MKRYRVIAVLEADLEMTPLGTRSRLAARLGGETVLRRTIARVTRMTRTGKTVVLAPSAQAMRVEELLHGTGATVRGHDCGPAPWRMLIQSARKWSLDGWRGGIGGATVFDEYTDGRLLAGVLDSEPADAVLSIPPAAPSFDPQIADDMIRHLETDEQDSRLIFAQAPPGITGILLTAGLIRELAEKFIPVGRLFSYKPDAPRKDLIFESCCYPTSVELRHASGRLIVDTRRAFETAEELTAVKEDWDSNSLGARLIRRDSEKVAPFPREVEIELTTEDSYPASLLHPRGERVKKRGPIDPSIVRRVASELAEYDDSLVVLGGFGDPLLHPDLKSVLAALGSKPDRRGFYGIALRTTAAALKEPAMRLLIDYQVDVLEVMLDAWTPSLYATLHSPSNPSRADLTAVLKALDELERLRLESSSVCPLVVPSFTKSRENVNELDEFYDGWMRKLGAVAIHGYSNRAGQLEDRSVINMAPATRTACRRLNTRCVVLADGRVTVCDQDFQGRITLPQVSDPEVPLGKLKDKPASVLSEIWNGTSFQSLRSAHHSERYDVTPLCAACQEWHRP